MKKWFYLIAPACMLVVFIFLYLGSTKKIAERDRQIAEKAHAAKVAEDQRKAEIEEKARLDAKRHAEERAAEDAKKEKERAEKWAAVGKDIQDQTDGYNKEAEDLSKTVAELQQQLVQLRKSKEAANLEYLAAIKQVELARVDKRTAELDIQRMTDMIAKRAEQSAMAKPPAPPAPAKS